MKKYIWQRNGGLAKSKKIRDAYNKNPNICASCKEKIFVLPTSKSLSQVRKKKFCTRRCAAIFNHHVLKIPSFGRRKPTEKICLTCSTLFIMKRSGTKNCYSCVASFKERMLEKTKSSLTHSKIRAHARKIIKATGKPCSNCGYNKFVETCHIKSVKNFHKDSTLREINHSSNLICLCPNCHWEFDHGLLVLK